MTKPEAALSAPVCPRCKGDGYYWLAPAGVNVFEMSIFHLASICRPHACDCEAGRAALENADAQ